MALKFFERKRRWVTPALFCYGFTLIELVVTLLLLSILAISATAIFTDDGFDEARHRAHLLSSLRNIQQRAMQHTQGCFALNIDASATQYAPAVNCTSSSDTQSFLASTPGELAADGISLSIGDNATGAAIGQVRFNGLGQPVSASAPICTLGCLISISGDDTVTACIEPEGFIHEGACQ